MGIFQEKVLFGNNRNIERNGYLWNGIAGVINAAEAVVILAVVTRTNGLIDSGIVSIAFSIANLMMTIGKFGIRNYQVTDIKCKYSFSTYLKARIVSVIVMVVGIIAYIIYGIGFKEYNFYKAIIIFLICLLYVVEAFEDVYLGLYQRQGRLDVASRIFSIRWSGVLVIYVLALIVFYNIIIASVLALIFSLCAMIYMLVLTFKKINSLDENVSIQTKDWILVLRECAPLFLATFLAYYVTNVPKYAIDAILNDEMQAYYGFIAMPVFIVSLINSFLYQPILVKIATEWHCRNIKSINKIIMQQIFIIIGITGVCVLGAFICGIPVLSLIYGTNLIDYKRELLVLLMGGGMLAITGFFNVILTVIRKQKLMLYAYCFVAVISRTLCDFFIKKNELMGAAQFNLLITVILALLLAVIICKEILKVKVEYDEKI